MGLESYSLTDPKILNQISREPITNGEDSPKLFSNFQTHKLAFNNLPQICYILVISSSEFHPKTKKEKS